MYFNFDAEMLIKHLKDEAIISVYEKAIPDDQQRKQFTAIIRAFTRRGIPADTIIDVLLELSKEGVL